MTDREPKERCGCGDRECGMCYPRKSKRQQMLDDDSYGDYLYEQRKDDRLMERHDEQARARKETAP